MYREPKIICVPVHDPSYAAITDISELPQYLLDEIKQFYDVYKEFDDGDESRVVGFDDSAAACVVIRNAQRVHQGRRHRVVPIAQAA
jgi:inorganic pyrophosphatase